MRISAWLEGLKSGLGRGIPAMFHVGKVGQRSPRRTTRRPLASCVESFEQRVMLTVEPITLTHPQYWGDSASGVSGVVSISADGQRVVFESTASNLVPNDFNGTSDVFLYERGTGLVSLISINSADSKGSDHGGFSPRISPDGRYVVFLSESGDLVTSPQVNIGTAGHQDVYVRDLDTDRTVLISSYFDGSRDSNNACITPSIATTSDGGVMVAWATVSAFMTPDDTNGIQDIFVRKLNTNGTLESTQRVSVGTGGVQANQNSSDPVLSGNGQVVVFVSTANNLVPSDDNTARDIFVHDISTGVTELVTVDTTGLQSANNQVWITDHPINFDGSRIVFHSAATNLSSLPTGGQTQVYVRDRVTDETRMVSVNAAGTAGIQGYDAGISSNGRFVVFTSDNDNLDTTTPDINFSTDIYLRDLNDQTTRLVSINATGTAAGNDDSGARIGFGGVGSLIAAVSSDDGRYVAFQSRASDLTATLDTNGMKETFVRDRQLGVTTAVAVSPTASAGNATTDAFFPSAVSANFRFVAVASNATNLVNDDANGKQDVFVRDLSQGIVELASPRSPLLPAEQLATAGGTLAAATPDGKFVAFISFNASQFDPDVSSHVDASLFVRNTETGEISVATVLPNGIQAPNGSVFQASFSNDGRYLAFNSFKVGLDATTSAFGIYLRDFHTGITKLISRNTGTGAAANAFSGNNDVVVSPDGRWVAFVNTSTNLVSGVTVPVGQANLYVYDRVEEELRLVTISTSGTASGNASSLQNEYRPVFSEDSSRLVYVSKSSDLVAGVSDANGMADVFAYDLTGTNSFQNRLVSQSATANVSGNRNSGGMDGQAAPSVSADGRFVAFASDSTNLAPESTSNSVQVYVRDLLTNTTRLVSFNQTNTSGGNGASLFPKISADGTRVLFQSGATNISPIAGNAFAQLFVRNLVDNTTRLVSVSSAGTAGNHNSGALSQGQSDRPVISANGRFVAFNSRATNLIAGQVQVAQWDLFVRDLATGITVLASANHTGLAGGNSRSSPNSNAAQIYLTNDGRVTFASEASDLFNGDRNQQTDVFAYIYAGGGQIGGKLFRDDDGSGTQNGAEPGVVYHTVFLDTNGNRRFDLGEVNVQTDSSGNYKFTGLAAGSYTVATEFDTGTQPTVPASPHTRSVTLATATSSVTGQDFGAQPAVLDLAVDSVTLTPATQPGQQVTVTWIGRNAGANAITTSWQDAVYLSKDGEIDASDLLLAAVAQTDLLGANSAYVGTATITLPAVPAGSYFILVRTDRRFQIDEPIRTNNLAASTTLNLSVPNLPIGSTTNVPFAATHPDHYFQFTVNPGEALRLVLDSAATSGLSELLVARGRLPTPADFDFAAAAQQPHQELLIPTTQEGAYYVLARETGGAAATAAFTLTPSLVPLSISQLDTTSGGNSGKVTLGIRGQRFTDETGFQLVRNGIPINAVATLVQDAQAAFVTFDLAGREVGIYDVVAVDGATSVSLPGSFTIAETVTSPIEIRVIAPSVVRNGGRGSVVVEYTNHSNVDVPAPFLQLTSTFAMLRLTDDSNYTGNFTKSAIQFLGIAQDGPAGILRAGQTSQMRVYLTLNPDAPDVPITIELEASILDSESETVDWQAAKNNLRPPSTSAAAWDVIFSNFVASVGSTSTQFRDVITENASYLSDLGVRTGNIARLMQFELTQSSAQLPFTILSAAADVAPPVPGLALSFDRFLDASIEARNRPGTLGFGWINPWETSMIFHPLDDRVVTVYQGGVERTFIRDPRDPSVYRGVAGDFTTIHLVTHNDVSRAVELREPDGTTWVFSRDILDGLKAGLALVEDPVGNRITLSGRFDPDDFVQILTHSSGPSLELHYNFLQGSGTISEVREFIGGQPTGRVATYGYDASFQHLTSVTTQDGTTVYSYYTGQGAAREHALASITHPDGTHIFYDYDDQGRLIRMRRDDDVDEVNLGYDSVAGVTFTDATGSTTVLYNDIGKPELVRDALGRTTQFDYDAIGNVLQSTTPLGATAQFRYDGRANVIGIIDPLGNQLSFTYDTQFNRLTGLTDARGNITRYERDANGSLVAITYADGSREQFARDAEGSLTGTINRRGQATQIVRDAQTGLVTREEFADGSHVDYIYDASRRLLTASQQIPTDSFPLTRITTFTYDDADFPDLVTRIDSFGGRFLQFTYDDGGRRIQSVDQDGFTVKYSYDAAGRLFELRDGSNALLTRYSYDPSSRLILKENGNGTYTTYKYDAAGQLLHLINRGQRPTPILDGPVNSRFDYTYDADGRRTSMGTLEGVTQYKYDAAGQLTRVTLPNSRTIQYEYDAAGNRARVIDSLLGTTEYDANELNQITSAGDTTFSYDADGNLVSESGPEGTIVYTWDDRKQLLGVIGPNGTFRYEYDAFFNRIAADRNGERTEYLIDPAGLGSIIGEYTSGGRVNYTHGYGLISRTALGVSSYFDFDALGSTVGITNAAGNYVNRYSYLPFGETTTHSAALSNIFQFVGEYGVTTSGDGLTHMRLRHFSSVTGQFVSDDPIKLTGGDINLRRYVSNSPVNLTDPSGLESRNAAAGEFEPIAAARVSPDGNDVSVGPEKFPSSDEVIVENAIAELLGQGGVTDSDRRDLLDRRRKRRQKELDELTKRIEEDEKRQRNADVLNATFIGFKFIVYPPLILIPTVKAFDPNDIQGPAGFGPQRFLRPDQPLPYTVHFENMDSATAPALEVTISQVLDEDLDLDTFELGNFGFGGFEFDLPAGLQAFHEVVDWTNPDGSPLTVTVDALLDKASRTVTWAFRSSDPASGEFSEDPFAGFLSPNDEEGRGEGFVDYLVRAKANLPTGTEIRGIASIIFDTNDPITTNQINPQDPTQGTDPNKEALVTIDAGTPVSHVNSLPATSLLSVPLSWNGEDDAGGSGIATYDIYVSDNGGAYVLWLDDTELMSSTFAGTNGHTYSFYSIATDNVGLRQSVPAGAQATTLVLANTAPVITDTGTVAYAKGQPAISILPLAQVVDTHGNLGGGSLRVSISDVTIGKKQLRPDSIQTSSLQALGVVSQVQFDNGIAFVTVQLSANVTASQVQNALRGVKFSTSAKGLKIASRAVTVQLTDNLGAISNTLSRSVQVLKKAPKPQGASVTSSRGHAGRPRPA